MIIALSYISDYVSIGFALLLPCYFFFDLLKTNKSGYDVKKENTIEDDKHEDNCRGGLRQDADVR